MIRRLGLAILVAGMALAGLATGTAAAAPACADYHWIGAAGSGQRDGAGLSANGGMGDVVYQSYQQLQGDLLASGRTITAEAVQYPAASVLLEGGLGGWMDFMDSVEAGTDDRRAVRGVHRVPAAKVVLAGYSQGAMVIHRNLQDLADDPHVAAALLIADGDRRPSTPPSTWDRPRACPASARALLRSTRSWRPPTPSMLPPEIGARTVSVCDVGDPVCDYDPDASEVSPAGIAIHTSYAPAASGAHAWGAPLYDLVMSASAAPTSTTELTAHGA